MNAQKIVSKLLENAPQGQDDLDDPAAFIDRYQTAWEGAGFEHMADPDAGAVFGELRMPAHKGYIWKDGPFSVEAVFESPHKAGEVELPRQLGAKGGWIISAYIDTGDEVGSQNIQASKVAPTEKKALAAAIQMKQALSASMAAKLTALGYTGYRNHWHKSPISVSLKPSYADIRVRMDYVPNDVAIKVLTALDKVADELNSSA